MNTWHRLIFFHKKPFVCFADKRIQASLSNWWSHWSRMTSSTSFFLLLAIPCPDCPFISTVRLLVHRGMVRSPTSRSLWSRSGSRTVGKIYTLIFSFFRKRVVNIMILDLRPVSNESPVNFTFYRGIHKFLIPTIFVKIMFYFILCNSFHFSENSVKWQQQPKNRYFFFQKCGDFKFFGIIFFLL